MRIRVIIAVVLVAQPASAQLSAVGSPGSVGAAAGMSTLRWPDIAYDPANDVYLAVSGAANIEGQYWSAQGAPLGQPFIVNSAAIYAQAPRVVYASGVGGFIVAWHASVTNSATQIRGRIVRYNQTPLTDDFDISSLTTNWEMGAAIAYSALSREALVAWQGANSSLRAQRISDTGAAVGVELAVEPSARYHRDPSVGYSAANDEYLVAYAGCEANDDCFVEAQRIQAGTGALIGTPIILDENVVAAYVPEVAFNERTAQWLVVWHRRNAGSAAFYSRRIASDGSLASAAQLVTNAFGSYDANDVSWNPVSNTFVFISHGTASQDVALELDARGGPIGSVGVDVGSATANGNFNPRLCANDKTSEWMAITSAAFTNLVAQRLGSLTRDLTGLPTDAGSEADGGSGAEDAGAGDAGVVEGDAGVSGEVDGGSSQPTQGGGADAGVNELTSVGSCGCAAAPGFWLTLVPALFFALRRRSRASPE